MAKVWTIAVPDLDGEPRETPWRLRIDKAASSLMAALRREYGQDMPSAADRHGWLVEQATGISEDSRLLAAAGLVAYCHPNEKRAGIADEAAYCHGALEALVADGWTFAQVAFAGHQILLGHVAAFGAAEGVWQGLGFYKPTPEQGPLSGSGPE